MIVGKKLIDDDDNRIKHQSISSSRFNNNININNVILNNSMIIGGKVELDSLRSPHIEELMKFKEKEKLKLKNDYNNTIEKTKKDQDEEYDNNTNNNNNINYINNYSNKQNDKRYHIQRSARYDNNNDNTYNNIEVDTVHFQDFFSLQVIIQLIHVYFELISLHW